MMKVLVPLDGSAESMKSMEKGLKLLKAAKPKVTLFCVRHEGFSKVADDRREMFEKDEHDEIFASDDEAEAMLEKAAARCKKLGITANTKCVVGKVKKEILAEAKKHDLLLMHHLDRESVKEKISMSNTEAIARAVDCSVLLV